MLVLYITNLPQVNFDTSVKKWICLVLGVCVYVLSSCVGMWLIMSVYV